MNIYELSQSFNEGPQTFKSIVVAASSEEEARLIHPFKDNKLNNGAWNSPVWAYKPEQINVRFLGLAVEGIEKGVIARMFK